MQEHSHALRRMLSGLFYWCKIITGVLTPWFECNAIFSRFKLNGTEACLWQGATAFDFACALRVLKAKKKYS